MTIEVSPDAHRLGHALGSWFEELEEILGRDGPPERWAREMVAPVFGQLDVAPLPIFDARSVAAAVYTSGGKLLAASDAFAAAGFDRLVDRSLLPRFAAGAEPYWQFVAGEGDAAASTGLIAYAPGARTVTWRLPSKLHEAAEEPRSVVVLTTDIEAGAPALRDACIAYGLTGLQARVVVETIRTGSIKAAARNLELSYQTAREALAEASRRVGAPRLPGMVTRLTTLAFGVFPGHASTADALADVWGLTERQIAVAGMVAEGVRREEIAEVMGMSLALVKKELDAAYSLLQVTSGAALARKLVEARAISWLTAATAGGVGYVEDNSEPRRFALRDDGSRIAFSDYGPASGRPVLVLHSSMTTRIVSRKLLRTLHRAGYRPIAIDRPGFGLSDPLDLPADADPFTAAVTDVHRVLEHLKLRTVDIVSRGAAQFLVALAGASAGRIGRVVLVNPGPPYRFSGGAIGPLAALKDAFVRNPATIRVAAPFLAGQITYRRFARIVPQWTRGSPPDQAAAQDPEFLVDLFRSMRMFATGRFEGFLREQAAISRGGKPQPFAGAAGWKILLGASDVLYEPEVVLDYWRELLPGAEFQVVADGGRFLAMTHPDMVCAALNGGS